jgi:hypothetical protein
MAIAVLGFVLAGAAPVLAYQTTRVVIVVLDGPRMSETFEELGQPHIPGMWNVLRPQGGYIPDFQNQGSTYTQRGHASLLTGTWQDIANDGTEHPTMPTLFEYYRAWTGASANDAWLVTGKEKLAAMAHSSHADYGEEFRSSENNIDRDDLDTYGTFKLVLSFSKPRLSVMSLSEVDVHGHYLRWDSYLASITRADSIITDLWGFIQSSPTYANQTAMIITYDHGRHLDDFGGYQNHGDHCLGCSRIGFLALGPDIEPGVRSPQLRNQRDICTTVAELLGFPAPFSEGTVLDELLRDTASVVTPAAVPPAGVMSRLTAFPNPFNPAVRIAIELHREGILLLDVEDALGRQVRRLEADHLAPGSHSFVWDGLDGRGRPAASGTYYIVARSGGEMEPRKVTLLR